MKTILFLGINDMRRILKMPLFYIITFPLVIFVFINFNQTFQEPYDTKEKYEEKLGYITYEELQQVKKSDFLEKIKINNREDERVLVFEHTLSIDERAKLYFNMKYGGNNYENVFNEFVLEGKITNVNRLTFEEIKNLSSQEYEKYQNSIFVPSACKSLMYFYRTTTNNYTTNYPTYEEAERLCQKENMSLFVSREFFFRIEIYLSLFTSLIVVLNITRDYMSKVYRKINATQIKSYEYIIAKSIFISIFIISLYFLICFIPYILFIYNLETANWIYNVKDFITNFLIFIVPSQLFICSTSVLFSVILRDWLFSLALSFYYIFLSGSKMTTLPDGQQTWIIYPYKYFPRIPFALGSFEENFLQICKHNILYFLLIILLIIVGCIIWKKDRFRRN